LAALSDKLARSSGPLGWNLGDSGKGARKRKGKTAASYQGLASAICQHFSKNSAVPFRAGHVCKSRACASSSNRAEGRAVYRAVPLQPANTGCAQAARSSHHRTRNPSVMRRVKGTKLGGFFFPPRAQSGTFHGFEKQFQFFPSARLSEGSNHQCARTIQWKRRSYLRIEKTH